MTTLGKSTVQGCAVVTVVDLSHMVLKENNLPLLPPSFCSGLRADLWPASLHANTVNTERWEDCQFSICKQKPPASPGTLSCKRRLQAGRRRQTRQRRERDSPKLLSGRRELKASRKALFFHLFIHSQKCLLTFYYVPGTVLSTR